jgi:hypothetical protein
MNIITATVDKLLDDTTVASLVSDRVYKFALEVGIRDTGNSAVVVAPAAGDYPGFKTWKKPRLDIFMYSDDTRNADGLITEADAEDRMYTLYDAVDDVLHFFEGTVQTWGGLRISSCIKEGEPRMLWDTQADTKVLNTTYSMVLLD